MRTFHRHCLTYLCMALVGLAAARAAPGEEGEPGTAAPAEPPRIYSTATVLARPLNSATGAVRMIEEPVTESSGARSIGEILTLVPGLQLLSNASRGGATSAQIRGGDPNQTLVLFDGLPINDWTDTEGGGFSLSSLPALSVGRIEVVSGPTSSTYGSAGLAGVIHLISRRPAGRPGEASSATPSVFLEGGTASLARARATVDGRSERFDYATGLALEREQGRVGDDRFEQAHLDASLGWELSPTGSLRVSGRWAAGEADDYPDASGGPVYGSGVLREGDGQELALTSRWLFGTSARSESRLEAGLYRSDLDRTSPPVAPLVPASVESRRFSRVRLGAARRFRLGPRLVLSGGLDWTRESATVRSTLLLPAALGGEQAGDYEIDRDLGGPSVELLWHGDRTTVEVAARGDFADGSRTQLSPRIGVVRRVGSAARLRASAGRAFKLPSFFALASPPQLGGNPDLLPERSTGLDLGLELDWPAAGASLETTLFAQRFADLVDFDFERFTHVNRAKVESHGIEVAGSWQPTPRWALRGALTWLEVEDPGSSEPLLHRPELFSRLAATWRPSDRLRLHLDAQQIGASFDRQLPVPERDRVAGYVLVSLGSSWATARGWSLSAHLDNLADRQFETLIGFPGAGRSVRAGVAYRPARRAAGSPPAGRSAVRANSG